VHAVCTGAEPPAAEAAGNVTVAPVAAEAVAVTLAGHVRESAVGLVAGGVGVGTCEGVVGDEHPSATTMSAAHAPRTADKVHAPVTRPCANVRF
jgi:hypothetical protein